MKKILLVEDNELSRDMLSRRLQRRGYKVVMAANGLSGVEMAGSETPDLILMDMNLPDIDGWEATQAIRKREHGTNKRVPIIAVTAHALSSDMNKALQAGCDDYAPKPIQLDQLLEKIQAHLGKEAG